MNLLLANLREQIVRLDDLNQKGLEDSYIIRAMNSSADV